MPATYRNAAISRIPSDAVKMDGNILECDGEEVPLSRSEARIISHILSTKHGRSTNEIIEALYFDDPNGGPEDAANVIHVLICKARKKMRPLNLGVKVYGGKFVLARLEDEQSR